MTIAKNKERVSFALPKELLLAIDQWAKEYGCSRTEFIILALERQVDWSNKNFDIPSAMEKRINQLIDTIIVLSENVKSLEDLTISGFDSLVNLTRGDNYLLEETEDE